MDDDRLESELQRRASGGSPRPEWAQRDLLPAVWREIDARPQAVVTSRLSPKWSVAAVIAALLLLFVAVPRLTSQLPSASGFASPSGSTPPAGQIRLTCDAPVVPGYCLQQVALAVAHLPTGIAPVESVAIMEINQCPSASPCIGPPHYYEWWAAFTLRDGADLGMLVTNTMGMDHFGSAVVGARPPHSAQPGLGSFTLVCGAIPDVTCTGAAGGSTNRAPNKPPDAVEVQHASGVADHYLVSLAFLDGTEAIVEVAPDPGGDNGWSVVATLTATPSSRPTVPVATNSPGPSLSAAVAQELEGWQVTCVDVEFVDCHGVAALFVNNLAWSYGAVFDESGGQVTVIARPQCPRVPSYIDPSYCWQAIAPTANTAPAADKDVCMVVGRDLPSVPAESRIFGFGQVGGDDMSGRAFPPTDWPPCV